MTTILTNILIFIVAAIVFARTSGKTYEIYKLPGLLAPSILSAVCIIYANISSIACTFYGTFDLAFDVCLVIGTVTIGIFVSGYDNFPLVRLLEYHKQVDSAFDNTPRISCNTFKKMYKLHPENFQFIDPHECFTFYSFKYRDKRFSLSFLDFMRALCLINGHVVERDAARERAKRVEKYEEQSKLYAMMRDDLNSDLAAIEKQKADAYDKIKTSTDNINEIASRLIKEAH